MLVLAELLQSCPNLCDPVDHSPPASSVHGILQASMECVAISYFKGSSGPRDQINISYLLYRQAGSLPLAPPGIKSSQIYWANCTGLCLTNLLVKASDYNAEDPGSIPGSGRSPGEGNGNPLSILAWRIPWREEPGRLQSTGLQRAGHDWATSLTHSLNSTLCIRWVGKGLVVLAIPENPTVTGALSICLSNGLHRKTNKKSYAQPCDRL